LKSSLVVTPRKSTPSKTRKNNSLLMVSLAGVKGLDTFSSPPFLEILRPISDFLERSIEIVVFFPNSTVRKTYYFNPLPASMRKGDEAQTI